MAIMICESCQIVFEGRPNRKYCSPECKRKAEMDARKRKKRERHFVSRIGKAGGGIPVALGPQ